ncbi:MAG: NAD-dependent epimerase/dehydratase family protein [Dongiaceae bacterium]
MLKASTPAPFAALRPTLLYGAADPHNGYGPNRFRRQAEGGQPILIFGEGEERRDHVAVDDVAALAALILAHRSLGALNAATGVSVSFHDVARMVAQQFGGRVPVTSQPRQGPPPHLTHRHFDIVGCHRAFPTFRVTPLEDGLRRAMQGA